MTTDFELQEDRELLYLLNLDEYIALLEYRPDGTRALQLRQEVPDDLAAMIYKICGLTLAPLRPITLINSSGMARPSRHDHLDEPPPQAA